MIRIATWNVNSIKARIEHLTAWLREASPDIVLLQELKSEEHSLPTMEIEDLGYNIAALGQKTYNGVAILSKFPIDEVIKGLPTLVDDEQARYIEAIISTDKGALRVASVYVPNGQAVDSDKFQYKMRFFEALRQHLTALLRYDEAVVIGGDYNVAPAPADIFDPKGLDGTVCYHPAERAHFRSLLNLGYYDAFRLKQPESRQYSWWDYRGGAYDRGHGYRIDHLLLNAQAVDMLQSCDIDESPRQKDKPSDHTPVMCGLAA